MCPPDTWKEARFSVVTQLKTCKIPAIKLFLHGSTISLPLFNQVCSLLYHRPYNSMNQNIIMKLKQMCTSDQCLLLTPDLIGDLAQEVERHQHINNSWSGPWIVSFSIVDRDDRSIWFSKVRAAPLWLGVLPREHEGHIFVAACCWEEDQTVGLHTKQQFRLSGPHEITRKWFHSSTEWPQCSYEQHWGDWEEPSTQLEPGWLVVIRLRG